MRVLIIEDETPAVRNLSSLLRTVEPLAEIAGITDSVSSSISWLKENNTPDVIFMDIHLADGDAFLIFEQATVSSPVIFTTAYDRYALDAFRVNSIDYLLKPILAEDLKRALDKLKRLTHLELDTYLHRTHQSILHKNPLKNFLVPLRDKILPLSVADIAYCHTAGEKVSAYTFDGRIYPLDMSLDIIGTRLPGEDFFRANRQFIVARHAIADMAVWYGNRLSINLKVTVPERIIVSKSRVSLLKRWLAGT